MTAPNKKGQQTGTPGFSGELLPEVAADFIAQSPDGIVLTDEEGRVIIWNPAAERITGWRSQEVLGQPLWEVQFWAAPEERRTDEARQRHEARLREALATGDAPWLGHVDNQEFRRPDGTYRTMQVQVFVTRGERGCRLGAIMRDVTELRQVERSLRETQERYRTLAESAEDFIYIIDRQGRVEYLNAAAARLLGFQPQDLLGRRVAELFAPGTFDRQQRNLERVLESGQPFAVTAKTVVGTREIWQETTLIPLRDDAGQVRAVMGVSRDVTARLQAEEALRESEERYRTLAESTQDAIVIVNRDGFVEYVNSAAARLVGRRPAEVIGKRPAEYFPAEEFARQQRNLQAAFASGQPLRVEDRTTYPVGEVWQESLLIPLTGKDGSADTLLIVARDITERKRAEEALRASEYQYRTTIDSLGDPIHVVTPDLRLVLCNKAMQRWIEELNLDPEAIGRTVFEVFPFLPDQVRAEYEHVFRTGQVLVTEESNIAGGREFFTETRKIPVYEEGQVVRVVTVIRDISGRKQAEAVLWQTKMVVEHSPVILYRLRAEEGWPFDFVSENVNQSGYTAEELLSRQVPFTSLVHPDDLARVLGEMEERAERGEDTFRRQYRAIIKSGEVRWVEDRVVIVRDPEGRVTHYQGVLLDVTENKRLEEQVRQAQKMETVGRLAGGVAHDFNNFLTAIRGYAGLAHDALRPEDPARADIEQVLKAAERATALTSQLLAFSRRQVIETRPANLNDLILDMEKMVRRLIGEDIELEIHLAPDLGLVRVDPGQITQALVNLLVNARDAMPDGGTVTLATTNVTLDEAAADTPAGLAPGSFIRLEVRDNGVGMSSEVQAHLFEPFFTTKEVGQGTGLGLASVYGIVKQHGGHIVVQSEPGWGTTVQIYLPQLTDADYHPVQPEPAQPLPRGHETILVVEDEPAVRALMVRVLRRAGYTVLEAKDGNEAIQIVRGHQGAVHLLLTDVVMPQMDGKVLSSLLRDARPDLRVLYVSGYATEVLSRHGVLQEGIDLLQKPFTGTALAVRVRQALDRAAPGPEGSPANA